MTDGNPANRTAIQELFAYMVPNPKSLPVIVRGSGAEIEDEEGRVYLDFEGGPGVVSVGHCHPDVVAAIHRQAQTLMQTPGKYHSRISLELARRIAQLTDDHLSKLFFANSGAEANDGATKLAMKYATITGKRGYGVIVLDHGYHGRLSLPLSLTSNPAMKKGFGPYAAFPGVVHVPAPYFYRCPFGSRTPEECGNRAAQALREVIKSRVPGEAAMMIAEPILGLSGVIVPPDNYWPQVQEICAEQKITLVMDEVFVGFGRTGRAFAHQHWNVKPSIMSFAKAIGGGIPLGGFIATPEVARAFESNDHNTTFGANNQVGIAAGHAVLDIMEREKLVARAEVSGNRLMEGFRRLASRYACIGEVRGKGLVIGIEIVSDRTAKTPAAALAKKLQDSLRENGVIIGVSGVHGNVLRMSPPLIMTDDQIEQSIQAFQRAFAATA